MALDRTTIFLDEVAQQPAALDKLTRFYWADGRARLEQWATLARQAGRVLFCGMGTSEFAPELILASLARSGVDASTADAGELLHYPRPFRGLTVLVSQSGESVETRKLAEAAGQDVTPVALVNNEQSTLARLAALALPMHAGHETAVSTKTYVNTLALLHLMACAVASPRAIPEGLSRLERAVQTMPQYDYAAIERAADLLADAHAIHFITRGPAMPAARQAALTFMEGARITGVAFQGGAFRHGPFELVDSAHRAVFFIPAGATGDLLAAMARETADKGSHVVASTDQDLSLPGPNAAVLKVPALGDELFALAAATTQELLLDAVADRRGLTAGVFRYGQKITARE